MAVAVLTEPRAGFTADRVDRVLGPSRPGWGERFGEVSRVDGSGADREVGEHGCRPEGDVGLYSAVLDADRFGAAGAEDGDVAEQPNRRRGLRRWFRRFGWRLFPRGSVVRCGTRGGGCSVAGWG